MLKPEGFDQVETQAMGEYSKPTAGPCVMKILSAKEEMSKNSRPMLVLYIDIADGEFKDHFKNLFAFLKSRNANAKWPCVHRRCTDGDQIGYFKGDIKAIEESNAGFKFNFDENTLKNKLVGCMLGEKEYTSDGKIFLEPRFLCSAEKAKSGTMTTPKTKPFNGEPDYGSDDTPDNDLPF